MTIQDADHLRFRPDIEGLRAIAILLVVAAHAGVPWLAGGFIGVDVFFVLSGFLITGKLVQEATATGRIKLLPFYLRRLRRLLPALLMMLLVVGVASRWLLSPAALGEQFLTAQMAALWLSNFYFALGDLNYFAPGSESNLYLHTWSLGVEEQFYFAWPALLLWLLAGDCERGVTRLRTGLWIVLAASLLACITLTHTEPLLAFYMMPLRAWQFSAGALVWLVFARNSMAHPRLEWAAPGLGLLGLGLILGAGVVLDPNRAYPGAWASIPTAGAALVVLAGSLSTGNSSIVQRLLSLSPVQWVGRISYSWYLWHWPLLLLGQAWAGDASPELRALLVALSLLLATLSHALVEAPLRRWKQWLGYPRLAALASLAAIAATVASGNHWTRQAEIALQTPVLKRYAAARLDAPIIYAMGCDDWYRSAEVRPCIFGDDKATHTAVLMGDSHIGQWFPAVRGALDEHWRVLVITKSSCPMVEEPFFYARIGREYTECAQWRDAALRQIQALKPELFIFGSAQANFTQKQWTEGTIRVLTKLSPAAHRIVLLADTPSMPFDGPECLMQHALRPAWLESGNSCSAPATTQQAIAIQKWLQTAAARFSNVEFVDMGPDICPNGLCQAELAGLITYRDNQHLSGRFAESLAPEMARALRGATP